MKMNTRFTVRVNGETFDVDVDGLALGDHLPGIGEQCDGCGHAFDGPDGTAILVARGVLAVECSKCQSVFALSPARR